MEDRAAPILKIFTIRQVELFRSFTHADQRIPNETNNSSKHEIDGADGNDPLREMVG